MLDIKVEPGLQVTSAARLWSILMRNYGQMINVGNDLK